MKYSRIYGYLKPEPGLKTEDILFLTSIKSFRYILGMGLYRTHEDYYNAKTGFWQIRKK